MIDNNSGGPRSDLLIDGGEADYYAPAAEEAHIRDYWKILVKRRRILLSVFFAVVAIGSYFTFTATRLFKAETIIKIEPLNPSVSGLPEMFQAAVSGSGAYDYYRTQFALLESRALAARVISELGLANDPEFRNLRVVYADPLERLESATLGNFGKSIDYAVRKLLPSSETDSDKKRDRASQSAKAVTIDISPNLITRYLKLLNVDPVPKTRLVEVQFLAPSGPLAQKLANTHATAFIRMTMETRFNLTNEAREFLGQKLLVLRTKVEQAEETLNQFRKLHNVVSMEKGENLIVDQLIEINKHLTRAKSDRIEAESLHNVVMNKNYQDLPNIINQGLIPSMRANLAQLEAEKARLSIALKPDHPRYQEISQQIDDARRALNSEIAKMARVLESNYKATLVREQALEAEAKKQQQKALNLKELAVEYTVLNEDVAVNRALYDSVLKRLHETSVSNDLAASNIQVVQRAEEPNGPSLPNVPLNIMLAMGIGLVLGVGSAFGFEYMDSKISTPGRAWHAVGLSTFGVVPDLRALNRRLLAGEARPGRLLQRSNGKVLGPAKSHHVAKELIVSLHPLSIITESYRTIRTALLFSQAEKPPQVILLTSPSAGEGKTVTTLNLAIAIAQDGHRVLVIDADLRRGCCHSRLDVTNHRGLTNVLTGQFPLEQLIQPTFVRGLSLLTRGACPPNPSDLLGSAKMREILKSLRESFDFILIDSPPAVAVSDAAVISVISDGVLLVVDGKKTTTASVRGAVGRLNFVRAPVLGVVLNRVDLRDPEYHHYISFYGSKYSINETPHNGAGSIVEAVAQNGTTQVELHNGEQMEMLPQEVFEYMIGELMEAMGPIAPRLVRDYIARMGASEEAFPKSRLEELVDLLGAEILSEPERGNFKQKMFQTCYANYVQRE